MLELKNLYFTVTTDEAGNGGKRNIIEHVNFTFEQGKFYGITGPNGSGKTTLAKLVMGINPVSAGEIVFDGKNISKMTITERAETGYRLQLSAAGALQGDRFSRFTDHCHGS